jgi:hypothetical protein
VLAEEFEQSYHSRQEEYAGEIKLEGTFFILSGFLHYRKGNFFSFLSCGG